MSVIKNFRELSRCDRALQENLYDELFLKKISDLQRLPIKKTKFGTCEGVVVKLRSEVAV